MRSGHLAVGICLLALAACGGDSDGPGSESEPRERRAQPDPAETGTGPRGMALDARCERIVRDTGIRMRMPARRAGEAFPAYERRVRHAVAGMARVYRMLYVRLRDIPGTQEQKPFEPFQEYLRAVEATADQFEDVAGYRNRNRVELRAALVYPAKQYVLLAQVAKALDAPSCAPPPG